MSDLEQRVKALEDLMQALARCFIAEPVKPKPRTEQAVKEAQRQVKPANTILDEFPEELRQHLTVMGNTIKTEYVSRDKWVVMDEIARKLGYRYETGKGWQK